AGCGLNLKTQHELPPTDAYVAKGRDGDWIEQDPGQTETLEGPESKVDLSALPPPTGAPIETTASPLTGPSRTARTDPNAGLGLQSRWTRVGLVALAVFGGLAITVTAWSL